MTNNTQKKSKRKGRNKQEVITVSQMEPEPEAVKTPIDLMRVSRLWLTLFFLWCIYGLTNSLPLIYFSSYLFSLFTSFLRPKKAVAPPQQRRKISLLTSTIKKDRTGCPSYFQADTPASALPRSTSLLTTASPAVALCVSKRGRDPASFVEAWYARLSVPQISVLSKPCEDSGYRKQLNSLSLYYFLLF